MLYRLIATSLSLKWGELVSNSHGIEVNNRTFRPQGPFSAVTQKYYRVKRSAGGERYLQSFHAHLNQLSANIQFTIKKEEEGRLTFLDVLVPRSKDQICTVVYRKPTNIYRYIPYHSHHHPRMLKGVI